MIDLNLNPSRKELRIFAGLFWVFFTGVAWYVRHKTGSSAAAAGILAAATAVGVVGLSVPRWVRPVYIVWMLAAFPIGWVMSHVLMGAIFYLVVTPIGLVMRACGRDPMQRKFDREATSYWICRAKDDKTERYFRQF
jgi:hypothetical protein